MKTVVETTGDFQLMGQVKGDLVRHNRPSVVTDSHFLGPHLQADPPRVKILGKVSDDVTDDKLAEHLKGGKKVEDFIRANSSEKPAPAPPAKP